MIGDALRMAGTSIAAHKARSFLTTLGVIIGVSSVITLLAVGEGLKNDVKALVTDLGTNIVFVVPGDIAALTSPQGATTNPATIFSANLLKRADLEGIQSIDGVETAAPMALVPGTVKVGEQGSNAMVVGSYPEAEEVFSGVKIEKGRFFTRNAADKYTLVLANGPAAQLFGEENSLGKTVTIGKQDFQVIGVLSKPQSAATLTGSDLDRISVIPFETATELIGEEQIFRIGVKIAKDADIEQVILAIEQDLLRRHEKGDVSVLKPEDILNLLGDLLSRVAAAVSAIAAISLLVGGIGIMNIMLVSVTERTREIGIRKAVGATRGAILIQFLIEAIVVSLLGGLLGLGLATLGVLIVDLKTPLVPVITPFMISLAIGVSAFVGIIFGLAPAISAARKNPIEALRYE